MKKLSAVVLSLMLCVSMSFAARGGNSSSSSSSQKKSGTSSSSNGSFGLGYSKLALSQTISGYRIELSFDEIAGRYWFDDKIAIDAQLGFGSGDVTSRFLIGGKVLGNVVSLNNLNVYLFGGLSFGNLTLKNGGPGGDQDVSVFLISGGVGAEYYVLPCLSVLTEMGIRYWSVKPDGADSVNDFGVYADWLPQAGVRFYF